MKKEKKLQTDSEVRINRYLADCGFGSRRKTEELILSGFVTVNGETVRELSRKIQVGSDEVKVRGKVAIPEQEIYVIALNKPKGYLCSHSDRFHEETVFSLLPEKFARLAIAGRLDLESRGLLLLSNDGKIVQRLSHPTMASEKEYLVRIDRKISFSKIKQEFLQGIQEGEETLRAEKVFLDLEGRENSESDRFRVILQQGRKRQIRRMFSALGARVVDLQRVRIGNILLIDLGIKEGEYVSLNPNRWRS
ncbi:pseudouridine synthase [Leptospira perolatii]|uniref:pseudouridine synthase n=1 Tax=Leptospira perolatii TaxID=2023191 RepID=UPI001FAFDECF|nr:pseudouridine synthase [Leptospira perolatii]